MQKKHIFFLTIIILVFALITVSRVKQSRPVAKVMDIRPDELVFRGPPEILPSDPEGTSAFAGFLEGMDTGCFAEMECFLVIDGKKLIVEEYGNENVRGTTPDVEEFIEFFNHMGSFVELKAMKIDDENYSLYGSEDYFIKII